MVDQRFFKKSQDNLTLSEICEISGARLLDDGQSGLIVSGLAPLAKANADDVSFLDNKKYVDQFVETTAGACFVREEFVEKAPEGTVCLVTDHPYMAYALTAQAFYPEKQSDGQISDGAFVDSTAKLGNNVSIEHGAVVKSHAVIGDNTIISANTVIGEGVEIGEGCRISENAVISHAVIGSRVSIAPGVKIGQPGFGFAMSPKGFVSVPQLGRVIIEDYVDIGANTTIDRGAISDTVIRQGTRIDNLVQLGHNVETGQMCVIVSQTGIAGSTKLGDFVMTGGQAGLAGHLNIGSGVKIAAQSGIMRDIDEPGEYMGSPAMPLKQYMRQVATLNKMTRRNKKKDS